jgi:hypothetical protein
LELIEAIVNSAQREKLLVRALFAQTSLVEHKNAMRVLNGAQPMRDDDSGASLKQPIESFADQ